MHRREVESWTEGIGALLNVTTNPCAVGSVELQVITVQVAS